MESWLNYRLTGATLVNFDPHESETFALKLGFKSFCDAVGLSIRGLKRVYSMNVKGYAQVLDFDDPFNPEEDRMDGLLSWTRMGQFPILLGELLIEIESVTYMAFLGIAWEWHSREFYCVYADGFVLRFRVPGTVTKSGPLSLRRYHYYCGVEETPEYWPCGSFSCTSCTPRRRG
jgi:hypothetical protein